MNRFSPSILLLSAAVLVAGCGDGTDAPTEPIAEQAAVEGRVELDGSASGTAPGARAQQASAQAVTVGQPSSDGSVSTLAAAEIRANGSFRVDSIPTGLGDLQVVARGSDGAALGRVMLHRETEAGATYVTAPIDGESTVQARIWSGLGASGDATATSTEEVTLLVRADAATVADLLVGDGVAAAAEAVATAAGTLTRVLAAYGLDVDGGARAELLTDPVVRFAESRDAGTSPGAAHAAFLDAAVEAYLAAGIDAEALAAAAAAASSTMDTSLQGRTSVRGRLVSPALLMNLGARARLAATVDTGSVVALADGVAAVLADAEAALREAATAAEIRTALDAGREAGTEALASGSVALLAADLSTDLQAEVEAGARAAAEAARLDLRLATVTSADGAAGAVEGYRSDVRAAVDSLIEASGRTDVDAEALTTVFLAAQAGAHIR